MRHPIVLLPAVVLACAGLDSAQARAGLWYRDAESPLFLHSVALWVGYAALGLPLIALVSWLLRRWRPEAPAGARWAASTVAVLVTPVLVHVQLDPYFGLGGDLGALLAPGPLALVAAAGAAGVAGATVIFMAAERLPALTVVGLLAASAAGAAHDPTPVEQEPTPAATAPADAPNILLLVWDTTRAASLDLYGRERATAPALARLGENARVYETARSASVFTLTSHLSMLTGTYPSHHGASLMRQTYDPDRTPSIARTLRSAGYRTGAFVGTSVLRGDTGVCDGFDVYDDRVDPDVTRTRLWQAVHDVQTLVAAFVPALGGNGRPHWFETFDASADDVLPRALEWIEGEDDRPWFCFVNLYDVHWPYVPSEEARAELVAPYDGRIDGYLFRSDSYEQRSERKGADLTDSDNAHLVDLYEAELLDLDQKVDDFWRAARRAAGERGLGAVITADHGEAFGEGGRYKHDDLLEVQVRIPMVVVVPRGIDGERLDGAVSGVDVAPTLLGFAGLDAQPWMPGVDLAHAAPSADRVILVENRDKTSADRIRHAVYRHPWKMVVHGEKADGAAELYDMRVDGVGLVDVADQHAGVVAELRRVLLDLRESWGADDGNGREWADGAGLADHLRALGYGGR